MSDAIELQTAQPPPRYPEVLAEIEQLQARKPSWLGAVLLLVVSALVFTGAGKRSMSWDALLMIVPIILFHELGHYLAMKGFGYRNLRIFFIPFFGAAVSGRSYNVAAWKKAIVSLMGPLPGIVLGTGITVVGLVLHYPGAVGVGLMAVIINAVNLLPVLPLDGGWLWHTLLFSRHHALDGAFRVLAAAALLLASARFDSIVLLILGLAMLMGLRLAYQCGRIVTELRAAGVQSASEDAQSIPTAVAESIIDKIRARIPVARTHKLVAKLTLDIFETLNSRPPGWLATLGLLAVYATALAGAVGVLLLVWYGPWAGVRSLQANWTNEQSPLEVRHISTWEGSEASRAASGALDVVVATFAKPAEAFATFNHLRTRLPPTARLRFFGQSVLVGLPDLDDVTRRQWYAELRKETDDVFVHRRDMEAQLSLSCTAASPARAAELEQELTEYLAAPAAMFLVAPWSRDDRRSMDQRQRHQRARRTYLALRNAGRDSQAPGDTLAQAKALREAQRQGDRETVLRLREAARERREQARRAAVKQVREDPRSVAAVVELYLAKTGDATSREDQQSLAAEMGPLLGQIPLDDGKPQAGAERYSLRHGYVIRNEATLNLAWLGFVDLFAGPWAALHWLTERGCGQFRYRLDNGYARGESEVEEESESEVAQ